MVSLVEFLCRSVLFDSDGVLVDSHLDGQRAWSQLSEEFGFTLDDETVASLSGIRTQDSLARFVAADSLEQAVSRLEDLEVELAARTPALPGALELLASIPDDRWAIATSASLRLGTARWIGASIPIPPVVVTAEDVLLGKPHPEPYLMAASRLGVDIADCLVVEDSPGGGQAGDAAGARLLAVGNQQWAFQPDARVPDLRGVECSATQDGLLRITVPTA